VKNSTVYLWVLAIAYAVLSDFPFEIGMAVITISIILGVSKRLSIPFSIQYYFGFLFLQIFATFLYLEIESEFEVKNKFNLIVTKEIGMISLLHLILMFFAFILFFKNSTKLDNNILIHNISKIRFKNLLIFYFIMSFIFPVLSAISVNNASLQQFFMALAVLKDFTLILFAFYYSFYKENRSIIVFIFLFEFLLGFVSYFSSFKDVILYIIIVAITLTNGISFKRVLYLSPIFVFVIYLMSFWSFVKGDYREFISNGEIGQNVNVDNSLAISYLFNSIQNFGLEEFNSGFTTFLGRAQYLEEYQTVVQNVPSTIPHQNGNVTKDAFEFIATPRFLNPNKNILDPSEKTAKYTGRQVANVEMGTSISLGFFTDLYIDFGFIGMTIALLILGVLLAWFFKYVFTNKKYSSIFNISILIAIITNIGTFESDLTFYLGILRNYIVVYIFCDLFLFKSLNRYLTGELELNKRNRNRKNLHLNLAKIK
jgi:hypothetical protein